MPRLSAIVTRRLCAAATCLMAFASHAEQPEPGTPIVDEALFSSIRDHYNGQWESDSDGKLGAEILKDGSVLVEVSAGMAEYFFYNIPESIDSAQYVPQSPDGSRRWLNYFNRLSDSVACGMSSYDLKKDPYPKFKCRFAVDSDGALHAFLDRTAETSTAKPPYYNGQWETDQRDFHWRPLKYLRSTGNAYNHYDVRSEPGRMSFHFQLVGKIAKAIYDRLDVLPVDESMGPFPIKVKTGKQIWCYTASDDAVKCRVGFNFAGLAHLVN